MNAQSWFVLFIILSQLNNVNANQPSASNYLPLVCPRHAVEIYQLPKAACPPLYDSEEVVKGSMIMMTTEGTTLDGFNVCLWDTTCSIEDTAGFLSASVPGDPKITHKPVEVNEYQAKKILASYHADPSKWIVKEGKAWNKDVCGPLMVADKAHVGSNQEQTTSLEFVTPIIRPNQTMEIGGKIDRTCDLLEGECQMQTNCWMIWDVPNSVRDWTTPIKLIEGVLYQSDTTTAVLHIKNEALSFHVVEKNINGRWVWVSDDYKVGFMLDKGPRRVKRQLGHKGSHLQFAIDLANHASHQLDWLCNNKAGTRLWQQALVGTSATLVARTFLDRMDIYAEPCGLNCVAVYHCMRVTSYQLNQTIHCYAQPPVSYRLPGTASEYSGYLDTSTNTILNAATDIPCESCPILYYQISKDQVQVIYPHGGVEEKLIKPFPATSALNPTPLKVTQVEGLFASRPVATLASGISQLRNILRRWTGSDALTPTQIQQIMENRALKSSLHITPNAGWVGYIFTALEWTAELGGLIVGSRFLTLAAQGIIGYFKNRHQPSTGPQ